MANSSSSIYNTLLLTIIIISLFTSCFSSTTTISYAKHCSSIVPESNPTGPLDSSYTLEFSNAYFNGGNELFRSYNASVYDSRVYSFSAQNLLATHTPHVHKVEARLVINGEPQVQALAHYEYDKAWTYRNLFGARLSIRNGISFELSGFWSDTTGKLCMVGHSTYSKHDNLAPLLVVLKLSYPNASNIFNGFISGTLESLDAVSTTNYFDSISLIALSTRNYEYTMINKANDTCSYLKVDEESVSISPGFLRSSLESELITKRFLLEYGSGCKGWTCNPLGRRPGFLPDVLVFNVIKCSNDGTLRLHIGFSSLIKSFYYWKSPLIPEMSLVGEGVWDYKRNRLCVIACRILKEGSVGDCNIGICLWFPSVLTIKRASCVVGRIWNTKNQIDDGYSNTISFSELESGCSLHPDRKYRYTELDAVKKSCKNIDSPANFENISYPASATHMSRSLILKDVKDNRSYDYGFASLVSIGETYYNRVMFSMKQEEKMPADIGHIWNVSYRLSSSLIKLSAEGVYNVRTGKLCMIGCRNLPLEYAGDRRMNWNNFNVLDCNILINFQLQPMNSEADGNFSNTISSTRSKSDPFYFEYAAALPPMRTWFHHTNGLDMKINNGIILMVSLAITVMCFLFQFFHVKKHQDALPSITLTMFVVLNLIEIIPLLVNLEALFSNNKNLHDDQYQENFWLEITKTIAGLQILATLLLQLCLIYVMKYARPATLERKVKLNDKSKMIMLCMALYVSGGLVSWFVQSGIHSSRIHLSDSLWDDMISYACLALNGFLLPQLILNTLWNPRDKALTPSLYFGTTILQAMPHFCYTYKVQEDRLHMRLFFNYVIPCQMLFLALLMFLLGDLKTSSSKKL